MHLRSLSIVNFKNYEQASLDLTPKINCFVGENGIGKTNLLDAIHYLALCKSNLNPVDSQNIRYEEDFAVIQGDFLRNDRPEAIYCSIRKNKKKQFKRNKKDYKKLAEHIGLIPLVMISPADSLLIQGGSEERRKFLNSVISQYDAMYLENVMAYNRILIQRNKLLKDQGNLKGSDEVLEILDQQLVQYGVPVYKARSKFIEEMVPVFQELYRKVSGDKEQVSLSYHSRLQEADFHALLLENRQKDYFLQYTSVGIHKDDISMRLGEYSLKKTASQGQQKTYLVALKLAEFAFMKNAMGIAPILLLDDIFDKFDASRVKQIVALVSDEMYGQIFISDTNETRMQNVLQDIDADHRVFHIKKDEIVRKE